MKNNTILELKNVQKVYENGFQAIFGMNLEIEKGEFVVFVGPSGCGKSTTIRMIAGLEKISTGELILDNRNATDLPARKRNIAMVFQNYALFPHLTVKENMTFTLKTKRVPRDIIEKKIKWAAEILELKYLLNRKPAQLSGGQRQRVALGRAIVAEPTLFLMDEPLSNLDAKLRSVMRTTIRKLHDQLKTTSIYVTHDQVEAMTMADKIVVMSNGFIQQVGTPEEIFTIPANTFVASFVGTPSINMIKTVKTKADNLNFKIGEKEYNFSIKGKKIIRNKDSKEILLGIRPQHIKQVTKTTKGAVEYNVDHIEMLGAETIVFTKEKLEYVCPTEEKPEAGKKVYLQFPVEKIQLFDEATGISMINPINKPTMSSIETFLQSEDLIQKRTALLESFKNKKVNSTLYEKIHKFISNQIWPQELLLNPTYSEFLEKRREIKSGQRDAARRNAAGEIEKYKSEYLKLNEKIKKEKDQIMKDLPFVRKFQSASKTTVHFNSLIKLKKKFVNNETYEKVRGLINQEKEINGFFNKNLFYNIDEVNKFNTIFNEINESFGEKINRIISNLIWPMELLINPERFDLIERNKKIKILINDLKSENKPDEINNLNSEMQKNVEKIKIKHKQIMKEIPFIRKFQKATKKSEKLIFLAESKKKTFDEKTIIELKRLIVESKEINTFFEQNLFYDMDKVNKFNGDFQKIFDKK